MAHPHILYKLPATRRKYHVRNLSPPTPPTPDNDDTCSICYRAYNEKDDPTDADETPCQPIQLLPCKHIIGSACFTKLLQADMDTCQVCRSKVDVLSNPYPAWLQKSTSWFWYKLYSDHAPGHALKNGKLGVFNHLSKKLFNEQMSMQETGQLWWMYMDSLSAWTRIVLVFAVFVNTTFAISDWCLGTPFVELGIFRIVGMKVPDSRVLTLWVDFPIVVGLAHYSNIRRGAGDLSVAGHALMFIMARIFALLFSIKGFALLLAANWLAYGTLTALLIWYGL
ncbi:unnamed protein product [Periconia digitata]|uniref:RING-type domain-containing protein n=1 Tax=Periconia digitata TaxID=1303443 RepID=A0A9W4U6E5_9PLEO|nr:unnamed protein product [Periconia digitata]